MIYLPALLLAFTAISLPRIHGYSYIAVVPNNIRPNSELVIPIQFNTSVLSETLTAKLFEKNTNNQVIAQTSEIVNGTDATLTLQVPSTVSWGSYRVNITGTGSIPFKNSTLVTGNTKAISIFVQTDKAMYKPNDTVLYRILTVNGSLAPINPTLDIEFFDPKGNKIDERMNVSTAGGQGLNGELKLSELPPLGNWNIKVAAPELGEYAKVTYRFEVQEYVLPKFEVTVTLPSFALTSAPTLIGTVKAEYVFGKPVQGVVILDITRRYGSSFYQIASARTSFSINGEAQFTIPRDVMVQLSRNLDYETLLVNANVTETLTGITHQGSGEIPFHKQPYKIEWYPTMPANFKPGFNTYTIWLKVSTRDGKPPGNQTETVKFDISYFTDKPVTQVIPNNFTITDFDLISPFIPGETVVINTIVKTPQADGTVKFDITIPSSAATVSIKAEFNGEKLTKEVSRFRSPGEHYLKLQILNQTPLKIGDFASVQVSNSLVQGAMAHYIVKSKGLVVKHGGLNIGASGTGTMQLKMTRAMAPSARIVVYYVSSTGEIIADGLNFVIDDIFENKVTISFNETTEVAPKTNVGLRVTADANSFVGVLVVDKSVKLLKEGNDITKDRVSDEMRQYGDSPWIPRSGAWGGMVIPWSFNADDASDIFSNARLNVLSDGNLPQFSLWSLRRTPKARAFASSPMGGAMAMDSMAGGEPVGQIRKDFPETWIWKTAIAQNGVAEFPDITPDTMTEFVASAFAISETSGLGVAETPATLQVALPFFVNLQIPYSVVRTEAVVIQANIFNSYPENLNVNLTLYGSDSMVGITIGQNQAEVEINGSQTKCVQVLSGTPKAVYFNIKPTVLGTLQLRVRASVKTPRFVFDEVVRDIPVKAEGEPKEDNIPVLKVMKTEGFSSEEKSWPVAASPDIVQGSERSRITVIGDVFGPSLNNLDKLIKLPYGCGEQNMVNFAPSVFAAVYMNTTGRFENDIGLKDKISNVLRTGYQRQLLYQRQSGSFSSFGDADKEGSLWLTAFVIKSFAQANKLNLVFIDPKVVERAVEYILNRQTPDGSFENTGVVNHKALQGSTASSIRSLTAYVIIVLQEVKESGFIDGLELTRLNTGLQSAANYLASNVINMASDYEKAIGAYALNLVGNTAHGTLMTGLESSPNKVTIGNSQYWENTSHSLKLEIASYVLMYYTKIAASDKGMKILTWLISNRGPYGGYASTQDTVVTIQATSEFAGLIYTKNVAMTIDLQLKRNSIIFRNITFVLNSNNHDVLQFQDAEKFDSIVIKATGVGLAMIDINVFYNVLKEEGEESYIVKLISKEETQNRYVLQACATYNISNAKSNMAIMDIGAITGFEPVKDQVVKSSLMKRIESIPGRIVIYFDEIPSTEICVDVPMQRVFLASNVQPASVLVYSYYEPNERKMSSYIPQLFQSATLCNICGVECGCSPDTGLLPIAQCGVVV